MKNKKVIIALVVFVLIVLLGIGFFVLSSNKDTPEQVAVEEETPIEETVNILSPEEIGLVLTKTLDNTKVIMEIGKTDNILSLEYELSYLAKGDIPRGAIGNIENKVKGKSIKQEIVLGTCSDVCHYDEDVSDVKLIVRVTKLDNTVYSVEETLD